MAEWDDLRDALWKGDVPRIEALAAAGLDLNVRDQLGEPLIFAAVDWLAPHEDIAFPVAPSILIARLITLGADPHALAQDGSSILMGPIISRDAEMLTYFLDIGIDPNRGCGDPFETSLDLASFDYWFEVYERPRFCGPGPVIEPAEASPHELADEDAYLAYLDREADRHGVPGPEIAHLLRRYGALGGSEIAQQLGGARTDPIRWRDEGWVLAKEAVR